MLNKSFFWPKNCDYSFLMASMLALALAFAIPFLIAEKVFGQDNIPKQAASGQSDKPTYSFDKIFDSIGGSNNFQHEKVVWNGQEGVLITGKDGERIFCNTLNGHLIIGELLSPDGENITRKMAEHFKAQTFLDMLSSVFLKAQSVDVKISNSAFTEPVMEQPEERIISKELFEFMEKLPGFEIGSAGGSLRLIIFTWENCVSCQNMKNIIAQKELPFRIREIPTGGSPSQEEKAIARLKDTGISHEDAIKRLNDATRILETLTGKVAVPCYAWKMPDGQYLFGNLAAQSALDRLNELAIPK